MKINNFSDEDVSKDLFLALIDYLTFKGIELENAEVSECHYNKLKK